MNATKSANKHFIILGVITVIQLIVEMVLIYN